MHARKLCTQSLGFEVLIVKIFLSDFVFACDDVAT